MLQAGKHAGRVDPAFANKLRKNLGDLAAQRHQEHLGQALQLCGRVRAHHAPEQRVAQHRQAGRVVAAVLEHRVAQRRRMMEEVPVLAEQCGAAGDAENLVDTEVAEQRHQVGPQPTAKTSGVLRLRDGLERFAGAQLTLRLEEGVDRLLTAGRDADQHDPGGRVDVVEGRVRHGERFLPVEVEATARRRIGLERHGRGRRG